MSKLRILCCCEHGNVRSVALAYLIKTIYSYDVIACGMKANSKETLELLFQWADKVIFLDRNLIPEKTWLNKFNGKDIRIADVGSDIWHNSKAEELNHKLLKQLKSLDL